MMALDLPAIHVGLHQCLQVQFRIGADEKGRLAIEQLGAFAQPVTERFDDHQLQAQIGARLAPVEVAHDLHGDFPSFSGGETADLYYRHGVSKMGSNKACVGPTSCVRTGDSRRSSPETAAPWRRWRWRSDGCAGR